MYIFQIFVYLICILQWNTKILFNSLNETTDKHLQVTVICISTRLIFKILR